MGDIAQIGFKAETSELDKAATKLDSLAPAAAKAERASEQLTRTMNGLDATASALVAAITNLNNNIERVTTSAGKETVAISKATDALTKKTNATKAAVAASKMAAAASLAAAAAATKETASFSAATRQRTNMGAFNSAAGGGGNTPSGSGGANDNKSFNTANIAAQFQDVGVTAAMGMNPLQIALQQGTQLSAVLQTMESPLKGIAAAFMQLINPVSLLTLGFVALLAAGLQWIDWVAVAKTSLNTLADVIESTAGYAVALAAVLALIYARTIIMGIASLTVQIVQMGAAFVASAVRIAAAWVVALGPIGLFIIAIAGLVTAAIMMRDKLTEIFGTDIVGAAKNGLNSIIGAFVGTYNGIVAVFKNLPAIMKGIFSESGASAGEIFASEFAKAQNQDYVGQIATGIQNTASDLADKLRSMAAGIGTGDKKKGKTDAEKFSDIVNGAQQTIATLQAEKDAIYLNAEAAAKLKYETELLNDARQKGLVLTAAQKAQLGGLASDMARIDIETQKAKESLEFLKDSTKSFISDLRDGLKQGQTLWESFGNAASRVLDKLTDKLLNEVVDALFTVGQSIGGSNSGSGGFLASIGSTIATLFSAKGNAFDGNGVQAFAKGSAFTNSIVTSPTMFKFAKGAAMGVMGEAGPEAVMPLKRGMDGSLGVQMHGGTNDNSGNGLAVTVNVINNGNAKTSVQQRRTSGGVEVDVMIDEAVGAKIGDQSSSINRSLAVYNNRQLITR